MRIVIEKDKSKLGALAAADGAAKIVAAIERTGRANIIVATGASQFEMFSHLTAAPAIRWNAVTAFHLDEYAGLPDTHPASFRKYLRERFVSKLPQSPAAFHYVNGDAANLPAECARLDKIIAGHPIDVAFVGIGENGHLAFNDPPADFQTEKPYIIVNLDDDCRRQQLGEGWFPNLDAVSKQAISMSIRQIMKSRSIVCTVPDLRKAKAVQTCLEGFVTNAAPASILQRHADVTVYLDTPAASLLTRRG